MEDAGPLTPTHAALRGGSGLQRGTYCINVVMSAAGIGRALASEFLKTGDNVIVSSRSEERVRSTVKELEQLKTGASVAGIAANVSKPNDVAALAKFASTQLGTINLWCVIAFSRTLAGHEMRDLSLADVSAQDQQCRK